MRGAVATVLAIVACASAKDVVISGGKAVASVGPRFVSVTLDASGFDRAWSHVRPFNDTRLINIAKGLSPAFLRVGGTEADYLYYDLPGSSPSAARDGDGPRPTHSVTKTMWDGVTGLAKAAGWSMVFGVSGLNRTTDDVWRPDSARSLLEYAKAQGILVGYELHNEEDLDDPKDKTNFTITPETTAEDFAAMTQLMKDVYGQAGPPTVQESSASRPMLIGSDVADGMSFLADFASNLSARAAPGSDRVLSALTWHHYYGAGPKMKVADFVEPRVLDSVRKDVKAAQATAASLPGGTEPWIGESGSSYGGGTPGVSDRFVSIFWYADQMAYAALHGHTAVCRQAFIGGAYTLVDPQPVLFPNSDYWLAALFKRLVGGGQLAVRGQEDEGNELRAYAACARRSGTADGDAVPGSRAYPPGSVTAVLINVAAEGVSASLKLDDGPVPAGASWERFTLTAPQGNLSSKAIELNGNILSVAEDGSLPPLDGAAVAPGMQALPAHSVTFLVATTAGAQACA